MSKRKNHLIKKILSWISPITITLFTMVLFIYSWDYIKLYKLYILIITGFLVILSILLGVFNKKKLYKSIKNKF